MFNIEHLHVKLLLLFVVDSAPWFRRDSHLINGGPGVKSWKHLQNSKHQKVYMEYAFYGCRRVLSEQDKCSATSFTSSSSAKLSPELETGSISFQLRRVCQQTQTTFSLSGSEAILMQKAAKLGLSKIENAICVFLSSYF